MREQTSVSSILSLHNVSCGYGALTILQNVSFHIPLGAIVALIGANGAGKTTMLRAISRMLPLQSGDIQYAGQSVQNRTSDLLVKAGMVHVPEGRGIFLTLSVEENLQLGAYTRQDDWQPMLEECFQFFPILKQRLKQVAGTLSGGEQQMLAIARAYLAKPKLLLLDEPSLGLAPQYIAKIFDIIALLHQKGLSILLVEQNAQLALEIASEAHLLETGILVESGSASAMQESPKVREAYLGK